MITDQFGAALDPLIGREDDLARLLDATGRNRLVTLTGPGGSGKTRLALAAVADLRARGRDAWFVDLSAVRDAGMIAGRIATTLDLDQPRAPDPLDLVAGRLRDRDALLVLDNVEQIAEAGDVALQLLTSIADVHLVATSRLALRAKGEVEIRVGPLGLPADATVAGVLESPAGLLFVARASAVAPVAPIDQATASDIARLLRRMDGLPLAIELAAARTRAMTPGEINRRLDALGPTAIDVGPDDRERSLGAIIDWTLGQLSIADTELLESASICAGFDLPLLEALLPGQDCLPALESLLSLGLAQRAGVSSGTSRFRVLQTIQATVLRGLSPDRRGLLADRHADHFVRLVEAWQAATDRGESASLAAAYELEADNIRLVLDHLEATAPVRHIELLGRLGHFWSKPGRQREGYERFQRARAASLAPSRELLRAAERQFGVSSLMLLPVERRALNAWIVDSARELGDRATLVEALRSQALLAYNEADADLSTRAIGELRQVVDSDDAPQRVLLLEAEAWHASLIGGPTSDAHVELLRDLTRTLEAIGEVPRVAAYRASLALVLFARGELHEALRLARQAAADLKPLDRPTTYTFALAFVGPCLAGLGKTDEAVEAVLECATASMEIGHGDYLAWAVWSAIPVALAIGRPEVAARLWGCLVRGMHARGETSLSALDRVLLDGWLRSARGRAGDLSTELAIRDGEGSDPLQLVRSLPELLRGATSRTRHGELRHGALTRREVEVLALVGAGRSDPEIASELFISPKTASVHVTNIKGKLGVDSRLQVALRARELGLVDEGVPQR